MRMKITRILLGRDFCFAYAEGVTALIHRQSFTDPAEFDLLERGMEIEADLYESSKGWSSSITRLGVVSDGKISR